MTTVVALVLSGVVLGQVWWLWARRPVTVARLHRQVSRALEPAGRAREALSVPVVAERTGRALRVIGRGVRAVVLHVVPATLGCAVLLVAVDWAAGALWDRVTEPDRPVDTVELASTDLPPTDDPRVDLPAMAGSPWAERYFAELTAMSWTYVPYVGQREAPVHGRYVNSEHGIRASYEPSGADGRDLPVVWFFGGSTLWGEGQRDRHTIPSEVARLAEAAGTPVRVVNFGIRGYSAFQELLVFERELTDRPPPDLVVFYHGFNELSTQTEAPENLSRQPTIFQLAVIGDAFGLAPALPGQVDAGEPSVRRDYLQTSAVHKLLHGIRQLGAIRPAGADEPYYQPPPAEMAAAVDNADAIYRRTMALLHHVAGEHEMAPVVFWQPTGEWLPYDELTDRVADVGGGIDISDALDDPPSPVFIDGIHTNELGARLVAEAMWPYVARRLAGVSEP